MNSKKILIAAVVTALGCVLGSAIYNAPWDKWATERICQQEVIRFKKIGSLPMELVTDSWDQYLVYEADAGEYEITYTVTSIGKDGTEGTSDDIRSTAVDLNKSKIVGHWVGRKAKEAASGFSDGVKKPSEFEGTDEKSKGFWNKIKNQFNKSE